MSFLKDGASPKQPRGRNGQSEVEAAVGTLRNLKTMIILQSRRQPVPLTAFPVKTSKSPVFLTSFCRRVPGFLDSLEQPRRLADNSDGTAAESGEKPLGLEKAEEPSDLTDDEYSKN